MNDNEEPMGPGFPDCFNGHSIFTLALLHEISDGGIFEQIRRLGEVNDETDIEGGDIDLDFEQELDSHSDSDLEHDSDPMYNVDIRCPIYYYHHTCIYCLESFSNPEKLHLHL